MSILTTVRSNPSLRRKRMTLRISVSTETSSEDFEVDHREGDASVLVRASGGRE